MASDPARFQYDYGQPIRFRFSGVPLTGASSVIIRVERPDKSKSQWSIDAGDIDAVKNEALYTLSDGDLPTKGIYRLQGLVEYTTTKRTRTKVVLLEVGEAI